MRTGSSVMEFKFTRLPRLLASVAVAAALALSMAGCSPWLSVSELTNAGTPPASNEVRLGISTFLTEKVTIKAGQSVMFVDSAAAGGIHYLCVGRGQQCRPIPGTPALLTNPNGLLFKNGDPPVNITFTRPGTYRVICTIHPGMVMTVVVK